MSLDIVRLELEYVQRYVHFLEAYRLIRRGKMYTIQEGNLPIFIKETDYTRPCLIFVVLFVDFTGFRNFAQILVSPDGINPPEPRSFVFPTFISEALPPECSDCAF